MQPKPTPYPDVNRILSGLLTGVQSIFGSRLVGFYLDGSLTGTDFDSASDIDFVAVTEATVTSDEFAALQALHDRLAAQDPRWGYELEGSYISKDGLRRYDAAHAMHPNIERGVGERLKWAAHDTMWDLHRYVLRERGITITGPDPRMLIDPVPPEQLRRASLSILHGWAAGLLENPRQMRPRGYQSYVVLTLCRALYTLELGDVVSKATARRWAIETLGEPWPPLIERAWVGRQNPSMDADPADIEGTVKLIHYVLEHGQVHHPIEAGGTQ